MAASRSSTAEDLSIVALGTDEHRELERSRLFRELRRAIDTLKQRVTKPKRLGENNPESASNASETAGPSRHVEVDDQDTDREGVKGKERDKNEYRERDRPNAIDDTPTDSVRAEKERVRNTYIKQGVILTTVGTACIVATILSHGLGAPVFGLFAIALDKANKEIGAAEEKLHKVMAKENGMA